MGVILRGPPMPSATSRHSFWMVFRPWVMTIQRRVWQPRTYLTYLDTLLWTKLQWMKGASCFLRASSTDSRSRGSTHVIIGGRGDFHSGTGESYETSNIYVECWLTTSRFRRVPMVLEPMTQRGWRVQSLIGLLRKVNRWLPISLAMSSPVMALIMTAPELYCVLQISIGIIWSK